MANTFYKPKNEYGELLISEKDAVTIINNTAGDINNRIDSEVGELNVIISDTEKSLTDKINEADLLLNEKINDTGDQLNEKIDTVEKQVTERIIEVDEKHSLIVEEILPSEGTDPHEHFRLTIETRWEEAIAAGKLKEFTWKLAKTVFLVKNTPIKCECIETCSCDDTYEEFICINTTKITEGEKPRFTRLGAVDSILATYKLPGSSVLVSDVYNTSEWENYSNGGKPVAGLSVAPIALKAFVEADKNIIEQHNNFKTETIDDLYAIHDQLKTLETEIYDTQEENLNGESRLDRLEKVIGINACCDNGDTYSLSHHESSGCCEPDCNILCKINDINTRLDDNNNNDIEQSAAIEATNETIAALSDSVDARFDEVNSTIASLDENHSNDIEAVQTRIDSEVEQINVAISETNASLDDAHNRITTLDNKHKTDLNLNAEEHAEIMRNVSANKVAADTKFYEIDRVDAAQNAEIGRIEDKIDREISDRITLGAQYSDLNNRINDIHTDCVSIRSDINAHEISAASAHAKFSTDIAKNAENLEIAKVQNAGEHSVFSTKIENAERKISEIQNIVTSHNESAQNEINSLRTRTTTLETGVSNLNVSVNELEINAESLSNRVAEIRTALDSNIEKADDNSKDITNIENRLSIAESSIASNNVERIKDINDIADSLTAEIAARETADINSQAACKLYTDRLVNDHAVAVDAKLAEKLNAETFEDGISDINEKIGEIKKELSEHKVDSTASFTLLDGRIESLESAQNAAEQNIDQIRPQIIANTSDIRNLVANVATNLQSINTLNDAVDTCEDNILSLTDDLDNIKGEFTEISSSVETLKKLVDTVNVFATVTLANGNAVISKEKILNRISAGEETFWTITVNSVQEEISEGSYAVIYPDIKYTDENIEITFGDKNINVLVSFVGINTTNNDIITL